MTTLGARYSFKLRRTQGSSLELTDDNLMRNRETDSAHLPLKLRELSVSAVEASHEIGKLRKC